jgi:hypothetical protein
MRKLRSSAARSRSAVMPPLPLARLGGQPPRKRMLPCVRKFFLIHALEVSSRAFLWRVPLFASAMAPTRTCIARKPALKPLSSIRLFPFQVAPRNCWRHCRRHPQLIRVTNNPLPFAALTNREKASRRRPIRAVLAACELMSKPLTTASCVHAPVISDSSREAQRYTSSDLALVVHSVK